MTDVEPATLVQRLEAAGISNPRQLIEGGHVRLDGDIVCDPDVPAPWPTPYVLI